MALQPRRLLSEICLSYCVNSNESALCPSSCLSLCPDFCKYPLFSDPPSSDNYSYPPPDPPHRKLSLSLTWDIFIALIAATILAVAAFALFLKRRRRRRRRVDQLQSEETHDEFLDQDHGPVVEHHIWYINTVGLQQSLIDSIAVFKYKTGEGLVEGTECSVCLGEFREDETLRLLPKCSHAFHVPCIDTWLRSHTNCPVCRAPVMSSGSSTEAVGSLVAGEETQDLETNGEGEEQETRTEEGGEMEIENRKEDETQTTRRSVSLDSSSALKIDLALANVSPEESEIDRNLNSGLVKWSAETGENRVVTNQSLLRVMMAGSSSSSSMKRSLSCSGKLFLSRNSRSRSRSRSMNLPL